jgi:hypothetical protein
MFSFLSDSVSEGSVYGGSLSAEASLRVEPDSGRTDTAPSIAFHLGPSDVVPLFQHSADQDVGFPSVGTINCTFHQFFLLCVCF